MRTRHERRTLDGAALAVRDGPYSAARSCGASCARAGLFADAVTSAVDGSARPAVLDTTDVEGFMAKAGEMVPIIAEAGCKPVSTLLGVTRLFQPSIMIEIEATAVA